MTHRIINVFLFIGLLVLMTVVGPALDDNSAEHEIARAALKEQRKEVRFTTAAKQICGPNAAWQSLGDGEIQCLTHKGRKTMVAKVSL